MKDINDTTCMVLQAYNDQRDILVVVPDHLKIRVIQALRSVVEHIHYALSMSTNVMCVVDDDIAKLIGNNDLVLSVGGNEGHRLTAESVGAYYAELDIDDITLIPYMISGYSDNKYARAC